MRIINEPYIIVPDNKGKFNLYKVVNNKNKAMAFNKDFDEIVNRIVYDKTIDGDMDLTIGKFIDRYREMLAKTLDEYAFIKTKK